MGTFGGRVRNAAGEVRQRLLVVGPLKYGQWHNQGTRPRCPPPEELFAFREKLRYSLKGDLQWNANQPFSVSRIVVYVVGAAIAHG